MKFQKGHAINLGRKMSRKTKTKISLANKGNSHKWTEKQRVQFSNKIKGHQVTKETRLKISRANKGKLSKLRGRKLSEEVKRKIGLANSISLLGKKRSKESIEKTRLANTGKKRTPEVRERLRQQKLGSKNPSFGRQYSVEERLRISESVKRARASSRNIPFQEALEKIRHSVQSKIWRENIFKRDNYTCIFCGDNKGGNLEADHIKPFILIVRQNNIVSVEDSLTCKELWDISNGRTLCIPCHKKTDTWGIKSLIK